MKENKKMNIGKIITIIFVIICILFFIMELYIIIQANTKKDDIPSIFGIKPMIVLTGSMSGTIESGDLAIIKETDVNSLKPGDIIAFRNNENTVTTHRIINITNTEGEIQITTKGDSNPTEDLGEVTKEKIEGKYIFKISGLGNFLMYIKEPQGLVGVMIIILAVGLLWIVVGGNKKKLTEEEVEYMKEFEEFKKQKEAEKDKENEEIKK